MKCLWYTWKVVLTFFPNYQNCDIHCEVFVWLVICISAHKYIIFVYKLLIIFHWKLNWLVSCCSCYFALMFLFLFILLIVSQTDSLLACPVEYAQVTKMLGNGRLEATCFDGTKRLCHIRGKLRKKVYISHMQSIVCVSLITCNRPRQLVFTCINLLLLGFVRTRSFFECSIYE